MPRHLPGGLLVATIFLSAFLLFQVQLIVAKNLLPWFGGAPAVWTTCQLFFQTALLAGYAYAHAVGRLRSVRRQRCIHLGLLATGLLAAAIVAGFSGLPVIAPESMKPTGAEEPVSLLLLILFATVGLPFLVLSATSPLLQSWHSHTTISLDRTYRLYAVSNAGSLLGLLSYPFAVEWLLAVPGQAWLWGALFLLFSVFCAAVTWRATTERIATGSAESVLPGMVAPAPFASPPSRHIWLWLVLPLLSSSLLLAVTNQLCQEVATVPFLWVLPLTTYLLTFIVCFDRPRSYSRRGFLMATATLSLLILPMVHFTTGIPISYQVVTYSLLLGCFCMVCHGELARLRPPAAKITHYYLLIALGGVLGAVFVSIAAPALFPDFWELHLTLLAGWLVFVYTWGSDRDSPWHQADRRTFTLLAAVGGAILLHQAVGLTPLAERPWSVRASVAAVAGALTFFAGVGWWAWRWDAVRSWPSAKMLSVLVILLISFGFHFRIQKARQDMLLNVRNFFGVIRVQEARSSLGRPMARLLMHGNIIHGLQFSDRQLRPIPTAYFSKSSGIGRAAQSLLTGRSPGNQWDPLESTCRHASLSIL